MCTAYCKDYRRTKAVEKKLKAELYSHKIALNVLMAHTECFFSVTVKLSITSTTIIAGVIMIIILKQFILQVQSVDSTLFAHYLSNYAVFCFFFLGAKLLRPAPCRHHRSCKSRTKYGESKHEKTRNALQTVSSCMSQLAAACVSPLQLASAKRKN